VAFWWVNQKQTWRHEIRGEFLWSPKLNKLGKHLEYYDNMTRLNVGDIVYSYINGALKYVGVVAGSAETSRRPDFGFTGSQWNDNGWAVDMRYVSITDIVPQDHLDFYATVAPTRHAPMNRYGVVVSQYLFAIPDSLGEFYLGLAGLTSNDLRDLLRVDPPVDQLTEDAEGVVTDPALTPTERRQLVRARVGQGLFKEEVRQIEPACRLTGLNEMRHLIASHMKPWSESTNAERLDGCNGLLLSPHVDHLFDRGFITFQNSGAVVVSDKLNPIVPELWSLDFEQPGSRFRKGQLPYLEYHRDVIFRSGNPHDSATGDHLPKRPRARLRLRPGRRVSPEPVTPSSPP
jgi:putative restriction endonuclease